MFQVFPKRLFLWTVKNRNPVVRMFMLLNILLGVFLAAGSWSIASQDARWVFFWDAGREFGEYAVLLYVLTNIPGICRRFGISHPLVSVLMMFRRQIGVTVFMLAAIHSFFLRIVPWVAGVFPLLPVETFVLFGLSAFVILFLLFVTSNDRSIRILGNWWGKIHDLTYVLVWILFLHIGLQKMSVWTLLIGGTAVLQISSHLYKKFRRPS